MPWPRNHKSVTRARIVEAAAATLRTRGVAGSGVAEIMERAGLTHGGFYAHFSSRDALLAEALERAGSESLGSLSGPGVGTGSRPSLDAVIDRYLSVEHAERPDRGCPVAALAPEIARGDGKTRGRLARAVRSRLAWLRGLVPKHHRGARREEVAAAAFACMVGGVILARTLPGAEGRAVLRACRDSLHRAVAGEPPGRRPSGTPRRRARAHARAVVGRILS
jgi:TetR/AcrR family transcriptional regulator, transcriptional repressor for nem operon